MLTAGQGPLPELMAPGPDPGPGGDRLGGGPGQGRGDSLPQAPSPPSLPGTPFLLPTELTVAETVGSTEGNPPLNKWGLQAQLGGAFPVPPRAGAAQDTAAPLLLAQGSFQASHVILTLRHHFFSRYLFSGHRLNPPLLLWSPQHPATPDL